MDASGKPSLAGRTISHYRINASIGAGGMGEVYRATDTNLGREVALKVLPADMARDADRLARFQREARVVAALNHPNVVTVYSVEEAEDLQFITMELVEGQPLDQLITANGLALERIVEIAGALAEALAAAHEKGIVHRDLKPANVMVTHEGRVKVLDFGLAKDLGAANSNATTVTSAGLTQAGMVMGTPAYMSPEQLSGRPLDHRTDIFSLGVLLHEMATGSRPFAGASSAELISSILRDEPAQVTDARPDLPADLARVIRRCLEKDPRHRLQTARDVGNEFRDMARLGSRPAGLSTAAPKSVAAPTSGGARADEGFWVAVLPFKCTGSGADLIALAEGFTDDIVTNMSKFSYLRVIARSSTARYANQAVDARAVAKDLGARYVMEGSIRQAGAKVRIAVQLVDAIAGVSLWAETYDRAFSADATLDLLDDVVPRIVATVGDTQGILAHSMTESLRGRDPESLTPYEALLRSFGFHQHVNAAEHLTGRTALEHAVQGAPDRADCWAMLSWLYRAEYTHGYNQRPDPMDRSLAAARRAVDLAPSSQLANAALASAFFFRRDLGSFRVAAERALALNQMEGYTTAFLGMQFAISGDWERGCALAERTTQLNPNHPGWYWFPAVLDAYRRHDGKRALEYALRINMPGLWTAQVLLAAVHCQLGQVEEARNALHDLLLLRPDFAATARQDLGIWWQPEMVDQLLGDLRKAGLGTPGAAAPAPSHTSSSAAARTDSGEARADEGFWVAVLPFRYSGASADVKALAEGITDEVITGLARFSYLRIVARGSTAKFSGETGDVRAIGKELGARYVMEGSIRQAGNKLRLAVQLTDTTTGTHLWAENYERTFSADVLFQLQDDLVPTIVSTVADMNGVLPRSMSEALRSTPVEQLSPYEAVLRSFSYPAKGTPEELTAARAALETAVKKAPDNSDAWAMLAFLDGQDYVHGFNLKADALAAAAEAGRRAAEIRPTNHLAHFALAQALFMQKEYQGFRSAAERVLALNPMDGNAVALLAELLTYAGDEERGLELAGRAKQLNPNHPGWYWYADFYSAYRRGDFRGALGIAQKVNMPGHYVVHALMAAAYGQLGENENAAKAIRELLKMRPDFASITRSQAEKIWSPEYGEKFLNGLRKAGLDIRGSGGTPTPSLALSTAAARTDSGEARAAEGFWVAVLPFKYGGSNQDLKALAEGITDEVITGLARFSYLRVVARGSTAKYSSETGDVRAIGKELGARYVMEGSLRQAGNKLRLAVQLTDTGTGTHLWAENYERTFSSEALFELQDDLVPRIVSTAADYYGILPNTICDALRHRKADDELTPYEAVLRAFSYYKRIAPEEHAQVREILERAARNAPEQGEIWGTLSTIYWHEYAFGFNQRPDPLGRAQAAARRSIDLAPTHNIGYSALGTVFFYQKDFPAFRSMTERAIELNPMDGSGMAHAGILMAYSGDWERGCALVESALKLNPHHPGWYWVALCLNAYRKGEYQNALTIGLKFNVPGYFLAHAILAAIYGQLGIREPAQKSLKELLALRPDFAEAAHKEFEKFYDPQLTAHLIDGLRKAGLEIPQRAMDGKIA